MRAFKLLLLLTEFMSGITRKGINLKSKIKMFQKSFFDFNNCFVEERHPNADDRERCRPPLEPTDVRPDPCRTDTAIAGPIAKG